MSRSWRAEAELPNDAQAPRTARALLDQLLHAWGQSHLVTDADIVVGELVANAVQHAADADKPLHLQAHSTDTHTLHIGLSDGSKITPVIRELADDEERGRGMRIVEHLTTRWGVDQLPAGKRVWIELHQP